MNLICVSGDNLTAAGKRYRCAIGKGGFSNDKKEGDGCTPLGTFALRECWFRLDRLPRPETILPLKVICESDGWSDDPKSAEYNKHIKRPYSHSHEQLWRSDHVYDLVIPLGYNDDPVVAGKGSAIFLHVVKDNYAPTEGCVALALEDLLEVLLHLEAQTYIKIETD